MFVCATQRGICLLEFVDRRALESEFSDLQRRFNASIIAGENAHTRQAQQEITEYFAGQRQSFEVALDTPGSEFQRAVWRRLQHVSFGETTHYQSIAMEIGKPTVRARWLLQTALTASRLSSRAIELSAKMV